MMQCNLGQIFREKMPDWMTKTPRTLSEVVFFWLEKEVICWWMRSRDHSFLSFFPPFSTTWFPNKHITCTNNAAKSEVKTTKNDIPSTCFSGHHIVRRPSFQFTMCWSVKKKTLGSRYITGVRYRAKKGQCVLHKHASTMQGRPHAFHP